MAPRGQKRTATETKKATAKKTRTDTAEAAEDGVMMKILETIQGAEALPASCRSMLTTGLQASIQTPSDERHDVQTAIVNMVDEVINAEEVRLQDLLAKAEANVVATESTRVELASKQSAAEASLASHVESLDEKTQANTAALQKVSDTNTLLTEKKASQETGDKGLTDLQSDKAAIQSAIDNDLKSIQEGQTDCQELLVLLQKLSFDESLTKALPATCGRGAPERGDFDGMVVKQLETSLAQKLIDLTKSVDDETVASKTRADAVEEAQTQAQTAADLQGKAADEQTSAEALRDDASAALDTARTALKAHASAEQDAAAARELQQGALESFRQFVRAPFELLRDAKASIVSADVNCDKLAAEDKEAIAVEVGGA